MMIRLLILTLLAGCAAETGLPTLVWSGQGSGAVLTSTHPDGSNYFARRLDGHVDEYFNVEVAGFGRECVVVMGSGAGSDQCKVFLLSSIGEILAEYRPPGLTPWPAKDPRRGDLWRVRVFPKRGLVIPFQRAGKRYLAVSTEGNAAPVSFTILEWTGGSLEERFVFWNYGHLSQVVIEGPYLVLLGLTNAFRGTNASYTPALAVFRFEDILRDHVVRGQAPIERGDRSEPEEPYRWYVRVPDDLGWATAFWAPRIEKDTLHAPTVNGLVYEVDIPSGSIALRPDDVYRQEFAQRRNTSQLLDLTSHIATLESKVVVWRGTR